MGTPKQLLPYRGRPIVKACVELLQAAALQHVYVVVGAHREQVTRALEGLRVTTVVNEDWETGMFSSVVAGFGAASVDADGLVIALVDQPHIATATIGLLVDEFVSARQCIVRPVYAGRCGHPLIVPTSLASEIAAGAGALTLKDLCERHFDQTSFVEVEDAAVVADVDTPDDYIALDG
jgi:molybdenum cofactor cytidylyltransferase